MNQLTDIVSAVSMSGQHLAYMANAVSEQPRSQTCSLRFSTTPSFA
jgi:hypothetical protein